MPLRHAGVVHPAALAPAVLLEACSETRTRRSGPGGQHRNKTETAVVLLHRPTGISAEASERRSQAENRAVAIARLRLKLAIEHRTPAGPGPSELWQSRCRGQAIVVSASHDDYPALIAEALNQLVAKSLDMPRVAATFGVTTTQLLKLFQRSPQAWTALNRLRTEAGLARLR